MTSTQVADGEVDLELPPLVQPLVHARKPGFLPVLKSSRRHVTSTITAADLEKKRHVFLF